MDFNALERAQIEHEMAMWTEIVRREKPLWKRVLASIATCFCK